MKLHNVQQGTAAWLKVRAGIPTASQAHRILTPTGKVSSQAELYMHELIAERLLDEPLVQHMSFWMARGSSLEKEAVAYFELLQDVTTTPVGFVTNDAGTIGASPDRLIGKDGLLEIKCPSAGQHVLNLFHKPVDKKHYPQIQTQLWVTERAETWILSYYPGLPEALIRVERDEEYIEALAKLVTGFVGQLEARFEKVKEIIGGEV